MKKFTKDNCHLNRANTKILSINYVTDEIITVTFMHTDESDDSLAVRAEVLNEKGECEQGDLHLVFKKEYAILRKQLNTLGVLLVNAVGSKLFDTREAAQVALDAVEGGTHMAYQIVAVDPAGWE